ncbi:hypothetical protein PLESTB_000363600 [Pleodorina starrii]|uniref:FAM194 C-terminal domain-containing protein n=1 Tax=Pleodorina starrii TaxID=330485 RepID=A0A9W6EZH4_9CHLO|nr:hypothetical protein PLESTM_000031600 [Pleodorina starrii]GLC50295.1 hypothetical protein PLESTB_000363600 [Pleodorina starrii]GLC64321.1 hypothetical protein PLESTF_000149000 [Pleodorina starrii]
MLASFNAQGIGFVYFPTGKPWLVVTESGYTVSDKKGNVVQRGKFPRVSNEVITLEASECIKVRFTNRQNIVAVFSAGDCVREWQCGEAPRRSEGPYTAKVVGTQSGGKLELDVAAIRQRQQSMGNVYVSPGPHAVETERPGVGSLKKALRRMDPACALASTVTDLRCLDSRLAQIDTMGLGGLGSSSSSSSRVLYGTARSASAGALLGSTGSGGSGGGGGGRLEDFGSPELSKTQQRFAAALMRPVEVKYKARRAKLPVMRLRDVDAQVLGAGAPADVLFVLVVLADWNPVCARVEAQVQAAHGSLSEEAAARSGSESARIKMFKVDASEGNTLQDRYGFRTVPMFLLFYQGKLVAATNNVRTEAEAREAALGALTRGRKGQFLPEGFRFAAGSDNSLLEYIRPTTVLREL